MGRWGAERGVLINCASTPSSCKSLSDSVGFDPLPLFLYSPALEPPQRPFVVAGTESQRIAISWPVPCIAWFWTASGMRNSPTLALHWPFDGGFLMCVIGERGSRQPRACMYVCAGRGSCLSSRAIPCHAARCDAMRCDATIAFSFISHGNRRYAAFCRTCSLQTQVQAKVVEKSRAKRGVHGHGLFCVWPAPSIELAQ